MALNLKTYLQRFGGDSHFYGNASHAFYDVLVWLQRHRPKADPNVVLPIFIPAKLYRLVLAAGYTPRFYDVPLDCTLDPGRVTERINDQTQAIFCVHYFGIPSPVQELRDITERMGIYLIEDCAHTINSRWQDRELGNIGDCALFSSRKMLQLPAGGFLVFKNQPWPFTPSYEKRVRSIYTACKGIRSRLKSLYFYLTRGFDPLQLAWIPSTGYIDFSEEQHFTIRKISRLNEMYTCLVDLDAIAGKRRRNFELVLNGIEDLNYLQPVLALNGGKMIAANGGAYRLAPGITPYSFPVLVPSGTRKTLRHKLCSHGIGCGAGWPESPFGHENFESSAELSDRLLELPIHQGMPRVQLERMIRCLAEQAESREVLKRNSHSMGKTNVGVVR